MDLTTGYLTIHLQGQHGVGQGYQGWIHSPPLPGGGPDLSSIFTVRNDAPQIINRGVPGGSDQLGQPPGSLYAPTCAGVHCDPVGGQPALTSLK